MAVVYFFTPGPRKNMKSRTHKLPGVSVADALRWAQESLALSPDVAEDVKKIIVVDDVRVSSKGYY